MLSHYLKEGRPEAGLPGLQYLDFFRLMNENLCPDTYFEIGTNEGNSLTAFACDALCVDPRFIVEQNVLAARTRSFFFQMTSDAFFRRHKIRQFFPDGPDICFLDGMHRFEFLLRDFINTERECHDRSMILLHDCLPSNERMAERVPRTDEDEDPATRYAWTGDVWRMLPVLKKYRPDLRVLVLDSGPTGVVVCSRLNPASTVLHDRYDEIVDEMFNLPLSGLGLQQLWKLFPMVDTARLAATPADVSAVFRIA